MTNRGVALVIQRRIRASAERLFLAWTEPQQLRAWWGPSPVTCSDAQVDLRVGGRYRIDNLLPNGETLSIVGEFIEIERPSKLVYTWQTSHANLESSIVTVQFEPDGDATRVIIRHDQIPNIAIRDEHERGWSGCLDGLARYMANETV